MYPSSLSTWYDWDNPLRRNKLTLPMTFEDPELDGLHALDPQAIISIHRRYFPEIFRYARYRLGDEVLAEDIAGEAFTRLLESVNGGRGPHISLRGWLMATASNLVNDHLRKTYTHPSERISEELHLHSNETNPAQSLEEADRNRTIREALAGLTPEQQQVIALRFGSGFSLEEAAVIMNKNTNAIKALQFRALASLRRKFGAKKK